MTLLASPWRKLTGQQREQHRILIPALALTLIFFAIISIATGAVNIDVASLPGILFRSDHASARDTVIVWSVRLPRTLLAILVGAALAASGAILQGSFAILWQTPDSLGFHRDLFLLLCAQSFWDKTCLEPMPRSFYRSLHLLADCSAQYCSTQSPHETVAPTLQPCCLQASP